MERLMTLLNIAIPVAPSMKSEDRLVDSKYSSADGSPTNNYVEMLRVIDSFGIIILC